MNTNKNIINLQVKKLADSVSFYSEIGFSVSTNEDESLPVLITGTGGFHLSLNPIKNEENLISPFELIQVNYPTSQEVDDAYNRTAQKGFQTLNKPSNTFWGTRSAKVLDPDGNNILLYTKLK